MRISGESGWPRSPWKVLGGKGKGCIHAGRSWKKGQLLLSDRSKTFPHTGDRDLRPRKEGKRRKTLRPRGKEKISTSFSGKKEGGNRLRSSRGPQISTKEIGGGGKREKEEKAGSALAASKKKNAPFLFRGRGKEKGALRKKAIL